VCLEARHTETLAQVGKRTGTATGGEEEGVLHEEFFNVLLKSAGFRGYRSCASSFVRTSVNAGFCVQL
jgi:hypothetical protein